ncbi:MAG: c-type cytochrome [Spirochaetales bacterium]|nr:c-type cytochrome [Spirochaetales bacterium]
MKSIFYSLLSVTAVLFLAFGTYCGQRPEEESAEPESTAGGMSAEAQHGQELFVANGCQTCHGERGHGDGPAGQALQPPPRNFQSVADYKQGSTVDDITNTFADRRSRNSHGGLRPPERSGSTRDRSVCSLPSDQRLRALNLLRHVDAGAGSGLAAQFCPALGCAVRIARYQHDAGRTEYPRILAAL